MFRLCLFAISTTTNWPAHHRDPHITVTLSIHGTVELGRRVPLPGLASVVQVDGDDVGAIKDQATIPETSAGRKTAHELHDARAARQVSSSPSTRVGPFGDRFTFPRSLQRARAWLEDRLRSRTVEERPRGRRVT